MFIYKTNPLKNQQKNRKLITSINKFNYLNKSVFFFKKNCFFLKNRQSIDLRFYKILLRKFKKKSLKKHIKTFVFLYPNNKLSNKSKNSRMGKGKGLFNRYYFRQTKIKPILIFININKNNFIKLKKNIMKIINFKLF